VFIKSRDALNFAENGMGKSYCSIIFATGLMFDTAINIRHWHSDGGAALANKNAFVRDVLCGSVA